MLALMGTTLVGCGSAGGASNTSAQNSSGSNTSNSSSNSSTNTSTTTADSSYQNAVKNGVTLGIYPGAPYTYIDQKTQKPTGIDWDIMTTALKDAGITKYKYDIMPWASLVPALLSKRIDILTGDIHKTPARDKIIAFTGPAWWYGPAIIVQKGNPGHISTYSDLTKSNITVGAVNGSAAQEYLNTIHAHVITYQGGTSEFTSLEQGRETAVLEDKPKFAAFLKANTNSNLEALNITPPTNLITTYGYGYARYALRKSDVSLNQKISAALAQMRSDGEMLKILEKWGLNKNNLTWLFR